MHGINLFDKRAKPTGEALWQGLDAQPEEIIELQARNYHRNTRCKPEDDGIGHKLQQTTQPCQPQHDQHQPGEKRSGQQSAEAIVLCDRYQQDDEGGGRPRHAIAGAAQQRRDEARDNSRIKPVLGRDSACDRQRHGQRNRDDPDR